MHTFLRSGAEEGSPDEVSRNGSHAADRIYSLIGPHTTSIFFTLDLPSGSDTWSSVTSPKPEARQHPFEVVCTGECLPRGCKNQASPHNLLSPSGSDSLLAWSAGSSCLWVPPIHHIWNVQLLQAARSLGALLDCCIWK